MNEFKYVFRLKIAYRTNSFIYYLKNIPIIRNLIPDSAYSKSSIKTISKILSILYEIFTIFAMKIMYIFFLFLMIYPNLNLVSTLYIFVCLTIIGAITNTPFIEATKDKYYAISIMKMDARKIALNQFFYVLIKHFIGLMSAMFLITSIFSIPKILVIEIPLLVVTSKIIAAAISLKKQDKYKYDLKSKTQYYGLVVSAIALLCLFIPYMKPLNISLVYFHITVGLMLVVGILSNIYLLNYKYYKVIYKKLLNPDHILFSQEDTQRIVNSVFTDKIEYQNISTNKKGYAKFNQIFIQRHQRLLTKTVRKIALGVGIVLAILILLVLFIPQIKHSVNQNLVSLLPYSLFLMYLLNRGESITKAMFINCDNAMLHYRFYRQPSAILEMFAQRLKSLVAINLPPALVMAIGLPLLLFISGGTNQPLEYVVLFITIPCLSVFFSVHYLVLYYLLQPYNSEVEMKNPFYSIITGLTYMICYLFMTRIESVYFGFWVVGITLLYIGIALVLSYRLSPKTFHLK